MNFFQAGEWLPQTPHHAILSLIVGNLSSGAAGSFVRTVLTLPIGITRQPSILRGWESRILFISKQPTRGVPFPWLRFPRSSLRRISPEARCCCCHRRLARVAPIREAKFRILAGTHRLSFARRMQLPSCYDCVDRIAIESIC